MLFYIADTELVCGSKKADIQWILPKPIVGFALLCVQAIDWMKKQYRKDAGHVPECCGKECWTGTNGFPIRTPPA
jgi:hypothetical protein